MGTVVYRVQAEDRDSGPNGQLSFDLMSAGGQRTFGVERSNGEIRLIGSLSYDSVPRYDLQVIAKDSGASAQRYVQPGGPHPGGERPGSCV